MTDVGAIYELLRFGGIAEQQKTGAINRVGFSSGLL